MQRSPLPENRDPAADADGHAAPTKIEAVDLDGDAIRVSQQIDEPVGNMDRLNRATKAVINYNGVAGDLQQVRRSFR